jgi:hypothetical protein
MVTPPRMSRSPEPFASLKGKLREGEGSDSPGTEILRCAQDDMRGWEGDHLGRPGHEVNTYRGTTTMIRLDMALQPGCGFTRPRLALALVRVLRLQHRR